MRRLAWHLPLVLLLLPLALPGRAAACPGDCGGDGEVTVDEVVLGVNLALGLGSLSECLAFDRDGSGAVTVDEIITAVNNALQGCSAATPAATPTATATATATPGSGSGPQLPDPRPTPPPGSSCTGYAVVESSNASPDNNSFVNFASPLALDKVAGSLAAPLPTAVSFAASAVGCSLQIDQVVRVLTVTIGGARGEPQAGSTYALKPGLDFTGSPTIAQVDYLEQIPTQAFAGRGWRAQSGTLTVESITATTMVLRISAEMAAERNVFPVGTVPPVGTFHLEAVIAVDALLRR